MIKVKKPAILKNLIWNTAIEQAASIALRERELGDHYGSYVMVAPHGPEIAAEIRALKRFD